MSQKEEGERERKQNKTPQETSVGSEMTAEQQAGTQLTCPASVEASGLLCDPLPVPSQSRM